MNLVEAALGAAAHELDRLGTSWALIGGFAVSARSEPRFTRDIDIAVAVAADHNAEALIHSLLSRGYGLLATIEQDAAGRLATVRLRSPIGEDDEGVVADLLFASSGIEQEIVVAAEKLEIAPGLAMPVAQAGHLIALKLLARDDETRPQDLADLRALRDVATDADWATAREAVELISQRGFDRGRDLVSALEALKQR